MPVKIETKVTREHQSPFNRRQQREKVSFASDDQDVYLARSIVQYGRGIKRLKMSPTEEGQQVRETTVFLGEELDEAGSPVEHEIAREKVLKNVGDSFTSTLRSASLGNRQVTTREITFTKVEKARVSLQDTETPAA